MGSAKDLDGVWLGKGGGGSNRTHLANVNIRTFGINLGIVMIENGIIGTCGGGDGIAGVALLDGVGGLTVFGGVSAKAEGGADGKVSAAFVEFADVERCELEPGKGE